MSRMAQFTSFGYLHDEPPAGAVLVLDVRHLIRDPHVDPALRQMNGRDGAVQEAVMNTPGASALVDFIVQAVKAANDGQTWTRVAIGCQGGRHRSVVLAEKAGLALAQAGFMVDLYDRDVDRPVVERQP